MSQHVREQQRHGVQHAPRHQQDRAPDAKQQRYEDQVVRERQPKKEHEDRPKKTTQNKAPQRTPIANLASLLLAVGLGFGAGILYSNSRKQLRSKYRLDHHQQPPPPYQSTERSGRYEDHRRLEYRRPDDRMSYMGQSMRESPGSTCWPDDHDGHWR